MSKKEITETVNPIEQLTGQLTKLRGKIAENRCERDRVEDLTLPATVAIATLNKKIDAQVGSLCALESRLAEDVGTLLVVIFADELKKKMGDHIKGTWPKETASDKEKTVSATKLDEELLRLELEEEATAVALEGLGATVDRRGNLNPAVFLECVENETVSND